MDPSFEEVKDIRKVNWSNERQAYILKIIFIQVPGGPFV